MTETYQHRFGQEKVKGKTLGGFIHDRAENRSLTAKDLALLSKIKPNLVSDLFSHNQLPPSRPLFRIFETLEFSPDEIVDAIKRFRPQRFNFINKNSLTYNPKFPRESRKNP